MTEPLREIQDSPTKPGWEVMKVTLAEDSTEEDREHEIAARRAEGWRRQTGYGQTDVYKEGIPSDARRTRTLIFSRRKRG